VWDTVHLILQGVPEEIELEEVQSKLRNVEHVQSIHHTHVWSLDGEHHVLTTHLILENISEYDQMDKTRQRALEALKAYEFSHHTIQVELDNKTCELNKG